MNISELTWWVSENESSAIYMLAATITNLVKPCVSHTLSSGSGADDHVNRKPRLRGVTSWSVIVIPQTVSDLWLMKYNFEKTSKNWL